MKLSKTLNYVHVFNSHWWASSITHIQTQETFALSSLELRLAAWIDIHFAFLNSKLCKLQYLIDGDNNLRYNALCDFEGFSLCSNFNNQAKCQLAQPFLQIVLRVYQPRDWKLQRTSLQSHRFHFGCFSESLEIQHWEQQRLHILECWLEKGSVCDNHLCSRRTDRGSSWGTHNQGRDCRSSWKEVQLQKQQG